MKENVKKNICKVTLIVLILGIAAAAIGCKQSQGDMEKQSQTALKRLLSCSMEESDDFDEMAEEAKISMEGEDDNEIGLTEGNGELKDYLLKQFGDSMTEACIENLAMNRAFYQSIALAKQFSSDIEAGEAELTKRSDEKECYSFSVEIKTSAGDLVADAEGTISMEKDGKNWKASKITLTMNEK